MPCPELKDCPEIPSLTLPVLKFEALVSWSDVAMTVQLETPFLLSVHLVEGE